MEFNHPTCYSLLLRFFYCETSACLLWKTTQVFPLCKLNEEPDDDCLPLPEQLILLISEFYWAGCLSHFLLRNILTGQTGLLMAEFCTSATVPGTWHSNMCWLKVSFTSNRIIIHFMNRSSAFPSKYLWQKFHQNKQTCTSPTFAGFRRPHVFFVGLFGDRSFGAFILQSSLSNNVVSSLWTLKL